MSFITFVRVISTSTGSPEEVVQATTLDDCATQKSAAEGLVTWRASAGTAARMADTTAKRILLGGGGE